MQEKKCSRCEKVKDVSEFWKDKTTSSGYRSYCKACKPDRSTYHAEWRAKNPDKMKEIQRRRNEKRRLQPEKERDSQLKYNYGISLDDFNGMIKSQDGLCKICCRRPEMEKNKGFSVDHDHSCCPGKKSCGKCIRGLLCVTCNQALGMFLDSEEVLLSAIEYLRNSRLNARSVLGNEASSMAAYF